MAKIAQVITRPSVEYDYTIAEAQTRDLEGHVQREFKNIVDGSVRCSFTARFGRNLEHFDDFFQDCLNEYIRSISKKQMLAESGGGRRLQFIIFHRCQTGVLSVSSIGLGGEPAPTYHVTLL